MGLNGSSDPSKGLPFPLGCWVLPASAVWAWTWQDNFLVWVRRIEVVSHQDTSCWVFRTWHLLVGSPKLTAMIETKPCLRHVYILRKIFLIRRFAEDRLNQEERDEPEYPNPRLTLKCSHSFAALPIEWCKETVSWMLTLYPRVVLDT